MIYPYKTSREVTCWMVDTRQMWPGDNIEEAVRPRNREMLSIDTAY